MIKIVDKKVALFHPTDRPFQALLAQLPNHLVHENYFYRIADPQRKWEMIESILKMIGGGEKVFRQLDFIAFPESSIPLTYMDEILECIEGTFSNNTVTILGFEQVALGQFQELLKRFPSENSEAISIIERDLELEEKDKPVNWFMTAIKNNTGDFHCYLEAKSHPFYGEEYLDRYHDLYQGKYFYLFKSSLISLNFIALICFDYVYRDLHQSNIMTIIEEANQMFFSSREQLDFLFIIQCNPKPEHRVFADTVNGFYGEYLTFTPGVRHTITVFVNTSAESLLPGIDGDDIFGYSSVVVNKINRLDRVSLMEFSTDDFDGAPVCRLRFGEGTRLYHLSLSRFHEQDPRSSRTPVKVMNVYHYDKGIWTPLSGRELVDGRSGIIGQDGND
jgi:hypothetical protein